MTKQSKMPSNEEPLPQSAQQQHDEQARHRPNYDLIKRLTAEAVAGSSTKESLYGRGLVGNVAAEYGVSLERAEELLEKFGV